MKLFNPQAKANVFDSLEDNFLSLWDETIRGTLTFNLFTCGSLRLVFPAGVHVCQSARASQRNVFVDEALGLVKLFFAWKRLSFCEQCMLMIN